MPLLRLSEKHYAQVRSNFCASNQKFKLIWTYQLNRYCMGIIFFIPLTLIAFCESTFDKRKHVWMETWFRGDDEGSQESPEDRNPKVTDPNCEGLEISKVPFEELIKVFPKTDQVGILLIFGGLQTIITKFTYSRAKHVF